MGAADGYLFYSCQGARAADLSHMPAWLQKVAAFFVASFLSFVFVACDF